MYQRSRVGWTKRSLFFEDDQVGSGGRAGFGHHVLTDATAVLQNVVAFDLRDTEADQSLDLACLHLARDLLLSKARLLAPMSSQRRDCEVGA